MPLRLDDFPADLGWIAVRLPRKIRYLIDRPDIRGRIAMTIKAHAHIQRLHLLDFDHLIDASVAANATDSGCDVRLVVEEHEIRHAMHTHPLDRLAGFVAARALFQAGGWSAFTRVWQFMHTSVGGTAAWAALVHRVVAVIAVHAQIARMKLVAVRDRLDRLIPGHNDLRIPH